MTFPVDSYLTAERALAQITVDATAHHTDVARGIETLTSAHAKLNAMGASWRPAVTYINAQAAANPSNAEWQALKARTDMIVADFIAMRNRALSIRDAAIAAG
jgi:hypothetical protein